MRYTTWTWIGDICLLSLACIVLQELVIGTSAPHWPQSQAGIHRSIVTVNAKISRLRLRHVFKQTPGGYGNPHRRQYDAKQDRLNERLSGRTGLQRVALVTKAGATVTTVADQTAVTIHRTSVPAPYAGGPPFLTTVTGRRSSSLPSTVISTGAPSISGSSSKRTSSSTSPPTTLSSSTSSSTATSTDSSTATDRTSTASSTPTTLSASARSFSTATAMSTSSTTPRTSMHSSSPSTTTASTPTTTTSSSTDTSSATSTTTSSSTSTAPALCNEGSGTAASYAPCHRYPTTPDLCCQSPFYCFLSSRPSFCFYF